MSERANGWLLIVGGLAIGLVLWLSPSKSATSCGLSPITRAHSNPLIYPVVNWQFSGAMPVVRIGTLCLGECREVC